MKATLLIKNIENLYTCDKDFSIIQHAFLAIHHDKIIDFGVHSYEKWMDPATVVIDARGETVVPGFIDCNYGGFSHVRMGDQLRQDGSALFAMQQNGILTLLTKEPAMQRHELTQDVFVRKNDPSIPIIENRKEYHKQKPEEFILSCGFGRPGSYIYSFQPLSYMLFNEHQISSQILLQAVTSNPAKEFHLKDRGSIEIGKNADLLVLQVPTIDHYYQTLGRPLIHRMIKNGIQFYPNWKVC